MKDFICSACGEGWSVKQEKSNCVLFCPFCAYEIPKPKEIVVTSFETAIQKVINDLSIDVLKERKRFLAHLMDIGPQYKKEIHILSKACDESAFKKIYSFANLQCSELEYEVARFQKILVEEEGISDAWASYICDVFCNILCEKSVSNQVIDETVSEKSRDKLQEIVKSITDVDEYIKTVQETYDTAIDSLRETFYKDNPLWSADFLKEKFGVQPGVSLALSCSNDWKVLDVCNDYVLLLNETCCERRPFNESGKRCLWKDSSLRKWLNDEYVRRTFSLTEIKYLKDVIIKTDGEETEDKVFLLGVQEIEKYNHLIEQSYETWLLRESSPINTSTHVMTYENGEIFKWGCVMVYKEYVKPMICLSIDYFLNEYINMIKLGG